jgi:hypothetical protein
MKSWGADRCAGRRGRLRFGVEQMKPARSACVDPTGAAAAALLAFWPLTSYSDRRNEAFMTRILRRDGEVMNQGEGWRHLK